MVASINFKKHALIILNGDFIIFSNHCRFDVMFIKMTRHVIETETKTKFGSIIFFFHLGFFCSFRNVSRKMKKKDYIICLFPFEMQWERWTGMNERHIIYRTYSNFILSFTSIFQIRKTIFFFLLKFICLLFSQKIKTSFKFMQSKI